MSTLLRGGFAVVMITTLSWWTTNNCTDASLAGCLGKLTRVGLDGVAGLTDLARAVTG